MKNSNKLSLTIFLFEKVKNFDTVDIKCQSLKQVLVYLNCISLFKMMFYTPLINL